MKLKLLFTIIVFGLLLGCGPNLKLYSGPEQPPEKLAYIHLQSPERLWCQFPPRDLGLGSLDIKIWSDSGKDRFPVLIYDRKSVYQLWWRDKPLIVLPGKYKVQIETGYFYKISGRAGNFTFILEEYYGPARRTVEFEIGAGQHYRVEVSLFCGAEVTGVDLNFAGNEGLIVKRQMEEVFFPKGMKAVYYKMSMYANVVDIATMQVIARGTSGHRN